MSTEMSMPFFLARARLELAHSLLERDAPGDRERAREALTSARQIAVDRGYAQVQRRSDRALGQFAANG